MRLLFNKMCKLSFIYVFVAFITQFSLSWRHDDVCSITDKYDNDDEFQTNALLRQVGVLLGILVYNQKLNRYKDRCHKRRMKNVLKQSFYMKNH